MSRLSDRVRAAALRHVVAPALARVDRARARWRRARRARRPPPAQRPLASGAALKQLLTAYYFEGQHLAGRRPVAWVTSGAPVEVLRALDYYVVYPENHAAICSARGMGGKLAAVAERAGFGAELCSYARIDIGSLLSGDTPVGRVPRPDLLVACTNICQTVLYWYRALAELTGAPLFVVDTPFVHGDPQPHQLDYVAAQVRELGRVAARLARRPLQRSALRRSVLAARESARLWRELLLTAQHRPTPWTAFDMFVFMAPIVSLRGLPGTQRLYRGLLAELRGRVASGVGSLAQERVRLLWDNLPVWFLLRPMAELLAQRGAAVVSASYTNAWAAGVEHFRDEQPYDSLAQVYLRVYLNRDLLARQRLLQGLALDFGVDGVLFHSDRSCKPYSVGQQDIAAALRAEHGLRCMVFEADHGDERQAPSEALLGRIEAFLETFDAPAAPQR